MNENKVKFQFYVFSSKKNFLDLIKRFDSHSLVNPKREAFTFLNMISILIATLKEYAPASLPYFELKSNKLRFFLVLYSHSTHNLIALYYKLFNFGHQKRSAQEEIDLKHLVRACTELSKPFNGKFFVEYLRKKPPTNRRSSFDKDACMKYAQRLLEANFISLVEIKSKTNHAD